MRRSATRFALAAAILFSLCASVVVAQQTSTTSKETKKFTVIAVDGNQLVVKLPEGTKEMTVPEDFRFTVDGQQLSVRELKPGMTGTATITTTTIVKPVSVTEVKNGTVQQVVGSTIIVSGPQGYKMFTQGDVDKRGVKIVRDGKPVDLSELRAGDRLTATIVTEKPPQILTQRQVDATLASGTPPAPAVGTAGTRERPATAAAPAAPGAPAPAPRKLPKTASAVPLVGLIGICSLGLGVALMARRRMR